MQKPSYVRVNELSQFPKARTTGFGGGWHVHGGGVATAGYPGPVTGLPAGWPGQWPRPALYHR